MELLTVAEVATALKVSEDTVRRCFENREGTVVLGTVPSKRKRPYRLLRIPRSVLEKFIHERTI